MTTADKTPMAMALQDGNSTVKGMMHLNTKNLPRIPERTGEKAWAIEKDKINISTANDLAPDTIKHYHWSCVNTLMGQRQVYLIVGPALDGGFHFRVGTKKCG